MVTDELRANLAALRELRIFFAHQSVGGNILDGLARLARQAGVPLRIDPPEQYADGPVILHGLAGRNGHPESKMQYFADAFARLEPRLPRVALMKFCYVDFTPSTNSDALFRSYEELITLLRRRYPEVSIVQVTVPLTACPTGLSDTVKRLLGRTVRKNEANRRRGLFNNRLRRTFRNETLFDLARIESTRPDGTLESFRGRDGTTIAALFPGYTSDGRHLNERGRDLAAAEFARVVAAAARTSM